MTQTQARTGPPGATPQFRDPWLEGPFAPVEVARGRGLDPLPGTSQLGGGASYVADNVVNTHIFAHAGKTWAFAEAGGAAHRWIPDSELEERRKAMAQ